MNTRVPEISILIATHNGELTLDRCFESLRKQTLQDFAIVCIDDASTDTTPAMLAKWKQIFGDGRMSVIRNEENLGLTTSLNRGLGRIHTKYTARIDDDDWWEPTKLEQQIEFLDQNPAYGVVGTNYLNVSSRAERLVRVPISDTEIRNDIFRKNPFAHSTVVFRTELVRKYGGYDESIRYGQDYELWLRLLPHTKFHNLGQTLCSRALENTLSTTRQREQMLTSLRTRWKYLRKYGRPIFEYVYLYDLLIIALLPEWIRRAKRRLVP
jgi:glycosyltransferase involved in cell wall biosynthesis